MAFIKVRLAQPPVPEWSEHYFHFGVLNYEDPKECAEHPDYQPGGRYEHWMYVNAGGYAQKYNPAKPPSRYPAGPGRLIIVPPVPIGDNSAVL